MNLVIGNYQLQAIIYIFADEYLKPLGIKHFPSRKWIPRMQFNL